MEALFFCEHLATAFNDVNVMYQRRGGGTLWQMQVMVIGSGKKRVEEGT